MKLTKSKLSRAKWEEAAAAHMVRLKKGERQAVLEKEQELIAIERRRRDEMEQLVAKEKALAIQVQKELERSREQEERLRLEVENEIQAIRKATELDTVELADTNIDKASVATATPLTGWNRHRLSWINKRRQRRGRPA
jgi:DNA-binding transcriptional regulator GbsR (MarR family)